MLKTPKHMLERVEAFQENSVRHGMTVEDYQPEVLKESKLKRASIPVFDPKPTKYYVPTDRLCQYDLYIHGVNSRPSWNASGDIKEFKPEWLAGEMSDGRIIPHYVRQGTWRLTRRGWENLKDFVLEREKKFNEEAPVKFIYHTEHNMEIALKKKEEQAENKIRLYADYYLFMEEAAELYRPKRGWASTKFYNLRMWATRKLMGR